MSQAFELSVTSPMTRVTTAMRQSLARKKAVDSWRVPLGSAARCLQRIAAILVLALPLSGFGSLEGLLAPSKDLWPRWAVADPASTAQIDHAAGSAFLRKYLVLGEDHR